MKYILTLLLLLSMGSAMAMNADKICQKQGNVWQCVHKEKLIIHSELGKLPVNITMIKILNGDDNPISMLVTLDSSHKQYWVTDCAFQTNLSSKPIMLKKKLVKGIHSKPNNIMNMEMPIFDYSDLQALVKSNQILVILHVKDLASSKDTYTMTVENLSIREMNNLQALVSKVLGI